eukprot:10377926-Prorocentrum_lima.AAC.1
MTSSLVGSEMCIRDRPAAVRGSLRSRRLRRLRPSDRKRRLNEREVAVSYTHLTLPTICSV